MQNYRKIEPLKVFVRYIPDSTTADELKVFFSTCGDVTFINIVSPTPRFRIGSNNYLIGFIMFKNQQETDRAVKELNGKLFTNKKGKSGALIVTHCVVNSPRSNVEGQSQTREIPKENKDEKNLDKDVKYELWQRFQANEEKLRQTHHDPAMEQELKDLKMKMNQLQVRKEDLEVETQSLRSENDILELQVKLQELVQEQMKLKSIQ